MEKTHPDLSNVPVTAIWAVFVGDLGRGALVVATVCFIFAFFMSLAPKARDKSVGSWFLCIGSAAILVSFGSLVSLFVTNQFAYDYVFKHSELRNAVEYKVASVWSGQEGSFLLWATSSAIFAIAGLRSTRQYRSYYVAVCSLFLGSICQILSFETPFKLNLFEGKPYIPLDGNGISPNLYNYWIVIHPPTIFLGFGSLIILFAFAVSALIKRDLESWVPLVRPWAILSTTILGLGLIMGGFWAYEMLGWGGFWMWDPVENASFVPWVVGVALIHGFIVQAAKNKWHYMNAVLAGLPFLAFCYGTFLTRSGFMAEVSVHSFATMERNALKVLQGILTVATLGFFALWFQRMWTAKAEAPAKEDFRGLRREDYYAVAITLLVMMGLATAIGMSVPLIQFIAKKPSRAVEEFLYHQVLSYMFVPLMLVLGLTPFASWRPEPFKKLFGRVLNVFSLSLFVTGCGLLWISNPASGFVPDSEKMIQFGKGVYVPLMPWMGLLIFLCAFAAFANLWRLIEMMGKVKMGLGSFVSHFGLAMLLAGLIISRGFERKQNYVVQPGITAVPLEAKGPRHLMELTDEDKLDFESRENTISLKLSENGKDFVAKPGLFYTFPPQGEAQPFPRPYIQRWLDHDLYVVAHPLQVDGTQTINLKPGETGELRGFLWATMNEVTYKVTYEKFVRNGEAGKRGTEFGAQLKVQNDELGEQATITPSLVVGEGPRPAQMDTHFMVVMHKMSAEDQSVEIGLRYVRPMIPVETFYKPMTILVWVGTGILTLGGFMSAIYRRARKKPSETAPTLAETVQEPEPEESDALIPVA